MRLQVTLAALIISASSTAALAKTTTRQVAVDADIEPTIEAHIETSTATSGSKLHVSANMRFRVEERALVTRSPTWEGATHLASSLPGEVPSSIDADADEDAEVAPTARDFPIETRHIVDYMVPQRDEAADWQFEIRYTILPATI